MPESKVISLGKRAEDEEKPFFEQLLQEGARKLLQAAIENEVIDYIQFHKDRRDENGQRLVVRNGHLPEREIVSGIGPIKVPQPRVRHRDQGIWCREGYFDDATFERTAVSFDNPDFFDVVLHSYRHACVSG